MLGKGQIASADSIDILEVFLQNTPPVAHQNVLAVWHYEPFLIRYKCVTWLQNVFYSKIIIESELSHLRDL